MHNGVLIHMTMTKRIQIPVEEPELPLVKAAAARSGLPLAEWARSILGEEARRELGEIDLDPRHALELLFSMDAPVADIDTMIEDSVTGRLR